MKLLLERVRQAGSSSSRIAGIIIVVAVFTLIAAPPPSASKPTAIKQDAIQSGGRVDVRTPAPQTPQAQTNKPTTAAAVPTCTGSTTFSASFTQGQSASAAV